MHAKKNKEKKRKEKWMVFLFVCCAHVRVPPADMQLLVLHAHHEIYIHTHIKEKV
jgi:hypothetical protein